LLLLVKLSQLLLMNVILVLKLQLQLLQLVSGSRS